MTRLKVLMTLALLCTVAQEAWAQTDVATASELRNAFDGGSTSIRLMVDIQKGCG